jgi:hypothetical protein
MDQAASKIDDQTNEPSDAKGEGQENGNAFHIQLVVHLEILLTWINTFRNERAQRFGFAERSEASPEGSEGEGGHGRMERAGEGSAQSGAIVRR